jgi:hypothetical protein
MRALGYALLFLITTASAGELPGQRLRPASEVLPVLRLRQVADLMLTDTVDTQKLGRALAAEEIRRTQDNSPMRPNEQVYFAATEQFQSVRLSIERDKGAATATPHTLYLIPTPLAEITLAQLNQTFGVARLVHGPDSHTRSWIHGPIDKRFVAHIIGEFGEAPTPANAGIARPVRLQIRIDRR